MTQTISSSDNKRLAKNTFLLYLRTLIVMGISLYTSRVILSSLGVKDYGTYNVIGGFVAMFSLVGGTLVSSTQRFLNVELGKKDGGDVNKIFNTAIGIHTILSFVLVLLFETLGLWFLNNKMNIPEGRLFAANVVFQCSVCAFLLNVLCMPYNAVIIAFERMKAFAYISLLDALLKLGICYLLYFVESDRLVIYAILLLGVSILNNAIYFCYCKQQFSEISKLRIVKDKDAYLNQTSFAGYTFLGSVASILSNHGVNIVLNLFCGVAVNASRGIAVQVQHAASKFVNDFMTALKPQITKTYAAGELDKSLSLVYRGAKFSFFLMLMISIPIIFRTDYILKLWLNVLPDYSTIFVRLTLIYGLITVLSTPLTTIILATGKIKGNALIIGGLRILVLPLSYMVLYIGYPPYSVYIVLIIIDILSIFTRLFILKSITGIQLNGYFKEVLSRVTIVLFLTILVNYYFALVFDESLLMLFVYLFISIIISMAIIWCLGLNYIERSSFIGIIKKYCYK